MLDRHSSGWKELLLRLVRRSWSSSLETSESALLTDAAFLEDFWALAARHSVHGLVLNRLASLDSSRPEYEHIRERTEPFLRSLRTHALLWDLERDRLVKTLAFRGVRPVLLKGAALRHTVYADPVERPLGDIDLLVSPAEFDPAVSVLSEIGYEHPYSNQAVRDLRKDHYHLRLSRQQFVIEVHWDLSRPLQLFDLDGAAFRRRARIRGAPGTGPALVPSPEDMVLHLVSQNLDHGTRLGRLVDIDRVLAAEASPDWQDLSEAAVEAGLEVALAVDLQLCRKLLGSPVPLGFAKGLLSPGRRRSLAVLRPETWAFSSRPRRAGLVELRRLSCLSDRFRPTASQLLRRQDPLLWIWLGQPRDHARSSLIWRVRQLGSVIAHWLWFYLLAATALVRPRTRRELRFWTDTTPAALARPEQR